MHLTGVRLSLRFFWCLVDGKDGPTAVDGLRHLDVLPLVVHFTADHSGFVKLRWKQQLVCVTFATGGYQFGWT